MMIMEEIGVAQERRPTSGGLKCPDELSFHDVNKVAKEWICDETKIEGKPSLTFNELDDPLDMNLTLN